MIRSSPSGLITINFECSPIRSVVGHSVIEILHAGVCTHGGRRHREDDLWRCIRESVVRHFLRKENHVDIGKTPFFYNHDGRPTYVKTLPHGVKAIEPAATNPALAVGKEYVVSEVIHVKKTPPYGIETQLGFVAEEVVYEPLWATRAVAAAFGITLVERAQAVRLSSPVPKLSQVEYEYGVFAGHWSPYQEKSNRLVPFVITDLEHHHFPHVFASTDPKLQCM